MWLQLNKVTCSERIVMSAERRCNHGAANSDDAQLICALWNESMAAWKQSNAHLVGSVRAGPEAYLLEICGVHSSSHSTLVPRFHLPK